MQIILPVSVQLYESISRLYRDIPASSVSLVCLVLIDLKDGLKEASE